MPLRPSNKFAIYPKKLNEKAPRPNTEVIRLENHAPRSKGGFGFVSDAGRRGKLGVNIFDNVESFCSVYGG